MNNYHSSYYKQHIKKYSEEEYLDEFIRITKMNGKNLTIKGFDETSKISAMSIIKGLKKTWKDLLVSFNKLKPLYEYAKEEYLKHALINGKANSTQFIKNHKYLDQYIFANILDIKKIRQECGFINNNYNGQYNNVLLKKHFFQVMEEIGKIPSVNEFLNYGSILPSIYCDYYGIKGQLWDEVLKIMIDDKEVLTQFLNEKINTNKQKAVEVLKVYKEKNQLSLMELEQEFRRVFEYYLNKYGTHPTKRIFNRESKYKDITYRKRLKMRWSEIAKFYGYSIKERNISEKIFLETLKKITKENYIRNKTWSWLLGINGKHLYCDGYFEKLNLVVELDGKHHRTPVPNFGGLDRFLIDKQNDIIKEKLVTENGIKFLRISTKENWENKDYLLWKISELGIEVI